MSSKFTFSGGALQANIRQVPDKVDAMVTKVTDYYGVRGENTMRKDAPWQDRTTNARNGLHVVVEHTRDRHTLTFAHGVPYGIWLEVRWAGKYSIIMPSVLKEGRAMMKSFKKILGST